jgi:hypothetical protein
MYSVVDDGPTLTTTTTNISAVKKYGNQWVAVAAMVSGRTNVQCRARWGNYLDPDRASNTVEKR